MNPPLHHVADPVVAMRPYRLRRMCIAGAVIVLAGFTASALLLRTMADGQQFRFSDQVAVFGVGACAAAGVMVFARPQVRADAGGVWVRNIFGSHDVPWVAVTSVTLPEKSAWAALEFADGDLLSMMAIQVMDGDRAVTAMRRLRELHAAATDAAKPGES
ncbi:MAG: PH domain-containing protein [Mycobacteriales bacterium]|nr:MAG: hypothetical protein DLM56_07125 [Pseudonocardiales bacterium]